ncbi:MAG: glycosyltransferase family 39 protein [Anaerolineales bacterium]|nr:glycosyltransferase family 39 protein [Anaerolineae bacterium]MCB9133042.1 glycosyltransferase family 39 protein [Anaerolineales bacterium]MCO5242744.1 hypothetical protein [Anaerolineae bacterium]
MGLADDRTPGFSDQQTRWDRWRRTLRLHWGAIAIGVVFLVLSLVYNITIPAWEADNELSHFNYVRYIIDHRALPAIDAVIDPPAITDVCRSGEENILAELTHQFRQPPLYYLLGAATTFWTDADSSGPAAANPFRVWDPSQLGYNFALHDPAQEGMPYSGTLLALHMLRLLSGLIGLAGLLATYLLGLLLFDGRRSLALAMMAVNAFIPQYLFASAIVNNDILIAALSSWCVYFCIYAVLRDGRARSLFLPAFLAALALTAKYNGLVLLPLVALTALVVLLRSLRSNRERIVPVVIGIGVMTLLASIPAIVLLAYNKVFYHEFFGSYSTVSNSLPDLLPATAASRGSGVGYAVQYAFATLWGQFGWDTITLPGWIVAVLALVCLLAAAGVILFLLDRKQPRRMRWIVVAASLFLLATLVQSFAKSIGSLEPRGRYIFPAISVICYLLVLGLHRVLPQRVKLAGVTALWIGLLILAIAVPFAVLQPAYAAPSIESSAELLPGEEPLDVTIGGFAQLLGYRVDSQKLAAGDPVEVTLVWKALQPTPSNYSMSIHLLDANRYPRAWVMSHPGHGNYPTSIWQPGDVFRDTYSLYWADTAWEQLPAQALLKVALFCPGTGVVADDYLQVVNAQGDSLGDAVYFGRIKVHGEQPATDSLAQASPAYTFGDEIALDSVQLSPETPLPGQPLEITMQWQALRQPDADYTVFAHLINAQGQWVTGNDLPLTGGYYPSSLWEGGETVTHTHTLDIPASLPIGGYTVQVGLYDPQSGQRLPVTGRDGTQMVDDQFELASFEAPRFRSYIPMVVVTDDSAP